ncbi:MAG TPA: flagellar export protein FliJ [Steroidobacter sp.]|nr:flagellar export protein FliJ [Steroidobacteraceae bacterium]HLS81602.1 flagellar export protein FliJ [Steroidobacter sp.]
MSESRRIRTLGRLVDLRTREVESHGARMAAKQSLRQRYLQNLARLEGLYEDSGASGAAGQRAAATFSPALSLNCGGYKQAVMKMADAHRADLSLHEADMAMLRKQLIARTRSREALDVVLQRERETVRQFRRAAERKRQDEAASQAWSRGGPGVRR